MLSPQMCAFLDAEGVEHPSMSSGQILG